MNLIEEVKNLKYGYGKNKTKIDAEQVELALAWLRGDVQSNRMAIVLYNKGIITSKTNYYPWLVKILRYAYDHGMISTSEVSKG